MIHLKSKLTKEGLELISEEWPTGTIPDGVHVDYYSVDVPSGKTLGEALKVAQDKREVPLSCAFHPDAPGRYALDFMMKGLKDGTMLLAVVWRKPE